MSHDICVWGVSLGSLLLSSGGWPWWLVVSGLSISFLRVGQPASFDRRVALVVIGLSFCCWPGGRPGTGTPQRHRDMEES